MAFLITKMFQFISTYRRFFIVILTMIFFVPCTVKRDLKQQLTQEIHQTSSHNHSKTISSETCSVNQQNVTKKLVHQQDALPSIAKSLQTESFPIISDDSLVWDTFTHHKEKIPTHIRYQLYLI